MRPIPFKQVKINAPSTLKLGAFSTFQKISVLKNGKIEYVRTFQEPVSKLEFNLPQTGIYTICTDQPIKDIKIVPIVIDYKGIELPKPVRIPKSARVTFQFSTREGSPAFMKPKTGEIFYNQKFKDLPEYCQRFIIEHEKGHLFYDSEFFCDIYAANSLLKKGYNYSEVVNALSHSLTKNPFNKERVLSVFNKISNTNK